MTNVIVTLRLKSSRPMSDVEAYEAQHGEGSFLNMSGNGTVEGLNILGVDAELIFASFEEGEAVNDSVITTFLPEEPAVKEPEFDEDDVWDMPVGSPSDFSSTGANSSVDEILSSKNALRGYLDDLSKGLKLDATEPADGELLQSVVEKLTD